SNCAPIISMSSGQDEASLGLNQDHCSADAATADSKEPSNHIDPNIEEAMEGIEFFDEVLHYQGDTGFGATANQRGANDFAAADQGESATDNHTANQTGACEIPAANQSEDAEFLKASQSESADISAANHSKATESPAANQVKVSDFLADIRSTDIAAANQSEATDIAATNRSEAADIATANQSEATDIAAANQSEATDIAAANQSIATEIAAANQSKAVASSLPNLDEAVDDVLANQSETFDQAPANQIESASSFITSEVAPANQSKVATESLADQREASADQNAAAAAPPDQDFVMAEVKTEVQSADVSAVSVGFDGADGEESEAARQAASWIEDASEAADSSASAVAAAKTEPVALLEAKIEPTETGSAAASAVERKPQVAGVNGGAPGSPSSQPCSSSTSSQVPIPGLSKALESALTRRQRHDLELTGSCPRCEKFREQIVFDENNEPQPGINILPDYLADGLDMVVIGINPSMTSAYVGHHYAGPGNHFWSCLSESGLIAEPLTCHEDHRICDFGIGFTNVCTRPTKGAADLTRKEMKEGAEILLAKLKKYKPKIAVFNGKGIYEAFVGNKNFYMGKQPEPLVGTDIVVFVMPSSSARCAQLPRAADKLPFYVALKKLRDYVVGISSHLNDSDVVFTDYTEMRVTQPDPKSVRKAERRRKRKAELAQLNQAAAAAAEQKARAEAAAAAAASTIDSKEAVQAKIAAMQQQQQQQLRAAAGGIKVEGSTAAIIGQPAAAQAGAAMPQQYALLTQQPGQFEWQIYQPTLYYQLPAANPADQAGGAAAGTSTAAAAAAYLRPQLQILQPADAAAAMAAAGVTVDSSGAAALVNNSSSSSAASSLVVSSTSNSVGANAAATALTAQQLGFANLLLLDPSQLQAAAAAAGAVGATVASSVALVPSVSAGIASTVQDSRTMGQQQHQLTYTTL
ncbi:hypothetical protein BOX15_Mlig014568g2, partial [Macrostomum lignano]